MRDDAALASGNAAVEATSTSHQHSHLSTSSSTTSASSKSPASRSWLSSVRRPRTSPGPKASALRRTQLLSDDDDRRDSALASPNYTTSNEPSSPTSLRKTPSLPAIVVQEERSPASKSSVSGHSLDGDSAQHANRSPFTALDTIIPTGSLDDLTSDAHVSFSKRGSMLLGGKKANRRSKQLGAFTESAPAPSVSPSTPPRQDGQEQPKERQQLSPPSTTHRSPPSPPPSRLPARGRSASQRVLSADEMMLSRKVRTMYKHGNESAVDWERPEEETSSVPNSVVGSSVANTPANGSSLTVDGNHEDTSSMASSRRESAVPKEPHESAGGLEDWSNLEGGEVDRYGFIIPKKAKSREAANDGGLEEPEQIGIQRVTTSLQLISNEPRRRRIGRSASRARSSRSADPRSNSPKRRVSQKSSRPTMSIFSNQTSNTRSTHRPLRHAANIFPRNKERRVLDEASDMLRLPPGLAEVAEQQEGGRAAQAMKAKEIERDDKWRRMARVVKSGANVGGMLFDFDTRDPKLIARTWKGIPDRWRATAWYSFLAASAKADTDSPSDEALIESFYQLQAESSAEDVQIDVDVPRTINRHIMFRRRYRGGQRLLFRVLHAMSLYLPDTGYVQGMAALTATLLCYYEEDRAFVMLVRLWQLRGLERLYEAGFAGLLDALEDFQKNWLRDGDVAKKLEELCIDSTAYGTRWYLTLFNYSLPFPAQLRVWDVFMLLGDKSHSKSPSSKFSGDLDVLHATSAALMHATRPILLDSDFENAMKVLTSWIPIKDEDILMRVAKAEYRERKKRANA